MQAQLLEHAQCMREHGVDDFPDPEFDSSGMAQISLGDNDPNDPTFRAAQEACGTAFGGPG